MTTIKLFAAAVGTELGVSILVGAKHLFTNVNRPKFVCVPVEGEVNADIEAGSRLDSTVDFEHTIGIRAVMCDWHIWSVDFDAADLAANSMYIAIRRVAAVQNSPCEMIGEKWITEQDSAITDQGAYVIIRASVGIRLIDAQQEPPLLTTPASASFVGTFIGPNNSEEVCS